MKGHFWTIFPRLAARLFPPAPPPRVAWSTTVHDPVVGPVRLTGRWSDKPGARGLVLVVHGLGGCTESAYAVHAACEAVACGFSCLSLNLRGADRLGEDYYHAGLTADVHAALASPELAGFDAVYLLGFSLGGQLVLRLATERFDPRLRAVAAVCPPLDLARGCDLIDRRSFGLYRRYVMGHLREIYAAVAARGPVPVPVAEARRIHYLREWDERVVAPRHGFSGADDYYARVSVGPVLDRVNARSLIVAAQRDPMVHATTLRRFLDAPPRRITVRWVERGGHVGFPRDLDLGVEAPRGLERQIFGWFRAS